MSAPGGLLVVLGAGIIFLLAGDPVTRVALAYALIAVSALRPGRAVRASLLFSLFYVLGLAAFAKLQTSGLRPIDLAGDRRLLIQAVLSAEPLLVFFAFATIALRLDLESVLNALFRFPAARGPALLLASAAAQLRYLEYLVPTAHQGQWARGALRAHPWWRRVAGLATLTVPLAVNFIIDADRRGELAQAAMEVDRPVAAPLAGFRPADAGYGGAYALAAGLALWLGAHG